MFDIDGQFSELFESTKDLSDRFNLNEQWEDDEEALPEDVILAAKEYYRDGMDWKEVVEAILDDPAIASWFREDYDGNEFDLRHNLEDALLQGEEEF